MSDSWLGLHGTWYCLAQADSKAAEAREALVWFGLVVAAIVISCLIVVRIRKRIQEAENNRPVVLFDLDELKRLRDEGELTIQQYESLKQQTIESTRAEMGLK